MLLLLLLAAKAIALVLGSLAVATACSWACWNAFKLIRHPELGVPACLILTAALCVHISILSPFLRLTLAYMVFAGLTLWPIGTTWRRDHPSRRQQEEL